jgi:hypothetical protein
MTALASWRFTFDEPVTSPQDVVRIKRVLGFRNEIDFKGRGREAFKASADFM